MIETVTVHAPCMLRSVATGEKGLGSVSANENRLLGVVPISYPTIIPLTTAAPVEAVVTSRWTRHFGEINASLYDLRVI